MKRLAVVAIVLIVAFTEVGCNKGSAPASTAEPPPAATATARVATLTPTPEQPSPSIDCENAPQANGLCKAYAALSDADKQLIALGAQVALSGLGAKFKQPGDTNIKKALEIASENLPINLRTSTEFKNIQSAYQDCANAVDNSAHKKGETFDDNSDEIADSCRFNVQRMIAQFFTEAGVKVPSGSPVDVFGLRWGETQAAIQKIKGTPASSDATSLTYDTSVSGLDALAFLNFVNGKLSSVTYIFTTKHTDDNLYINNFDSVDTALQQKYGKANQHGVYWRNDLYKDDRAHWGLAIATGQMYMDSSWETDDTEISHRLVGDNFNVTHGVRYVGREYRLAAKAAKQAAENKNL